MSAQSSQITVAVVTDDAALYADDDEKAEETEEQDDCCSHYAIKRPRSSHPENDDSHVRPSSSFACHNDSPEALFTKIATLYCRRFSSPKWNDFKGVSLDVHEVTRLNNLIWREWYRQGVAGQRTAPFSFTCAVDDPVHCQPLAVVLEGKYWKRKFDAVIEEYRQWRRFGRERRSSAKATETLESTICIPDSMAQQDDLQAPNVVAVQSPNGYCSFPRRSWAKASETLESTICVPDSVAQQDDDMVTVQSPQSNCRSQSSLDLDALLDYWAANSADLSDPTPESNPSAVEPGVVVVVDVQRPHSDDSNPDSVMELLDSCEASCSTEALLHPQQDAVDVLAITTATFQPKTSVDTPCLPCASPKRIGAMPPPSQAKRAHLVARKRRVNAMNGVSILRDILPLTAGNKGSRLSNANVMALAAASCRQMRAEKAKLEEQAALMRLNIEQRRQDILRSQTIVATDGMPVAPCNRQLFDAWVCTRSSENYKFALFAELIAPLFDSFMASVSVLNADELSRSLLDWQHEHFTLGSFRHSVLSSLTDWSQSTSILASPKTFPAELRARAWSNDSTDGRFCRQRLS